jgi:hypothetical protein
MGAVTMENAHIRIPTLPNGAEKRKRQRSREPRALTYPQVIARLTGPATPLSAMKLPYRYCPTSWSRNA